MTPLLMDKTKPLSERGSGIVFATFGYDSTRTEGASVNPLTSLWLELKNVDGSGRNVRINTNDELVMAGGWRISEITKKDNGYITLISATSLPEGDYNLLSVLVEIPLAGATYRTSFPEKQAFRFSVKEGVATYLGHYKFNNQAGNNILGYPVPSRIEMIRLNNFISDKDFLVHVRPEAVKLNFKNSLDNQTQSP